ncbi:MAG: autotransporter domain-containing protein [Gemmatimonadales bacterium]|nr:autotransporter domain-containing protein [Gemmatimonadales bacterium]
MHVGRVVLVAAWLGLVAPTLVAQVAAGSGGGPVASRQGTWLGVGIGGGASTLNCRICEGEQGSRGISGYLRGGVTLNPKLLVGAEANAWTRSDERGNQRVWSLAANGYWYPNPEHGYFLKAGLGFTRYRRWALENSNSTVQIGLLGGGLSAHLGAGYEVRVNPNMSIVPFLNLLASSQGALATTRDNGTQYQRNTLSNGANVLLAQAGIGLTWH